MRRSLRLSPRSANKQIIEEREKKTNATEMKCRNEDREDEGGKGSWEWIHSKLQLVAVILFTFNCMQDEPSEHCRTH